jgi:predicted unusual protein kinase regulating ubiquinone biosynthesis (AarF/ABC1/UbiB family)
LIQPQVVQAELGGKASRFFSKITPAPVAAASLGQVYRATLKDTGEEVAIKVQRPGVLELVALDLVLGRRGIQIAGQLFPAVRSGHRSARERPQAPGARFTVCGNHLLRDDGGPTRLRI